MTREVSFYKKRKCWYAYLPEFIALGGTEAECKMVSGADTFLDLIAGHRYDGKAMNYVTVKISDDEQLAYSMEQIDSDEFGSSYIILNYDTVACNHFLWLCPVTLSVFDNYPETIYFNVVERRVNTTSIKYEKTSTLKKIWHIAKLTPRFVKKQIKRKLKLIR
jgi:hypothetical protein